jgi:hypothetical protein
MMSWIGLQQLQNQPIHGAWHFRPPAAQRRKRTPWPFSAKGLVQHHSDRIEIARRLGRPPCPLLGGHVRESAENGARAFG